MSRELPVAEAPSSQLLPPQRRVPEEDKRTGLFSALKVSLHAPYWLRITLFGAALSVETEDALMKLRPLIDAYQLLCVVLEGHVGGAEAMLRLGEVQAEGRSGNPVQSPSNAVAKRGETLLRGRVV